MFCFYFFSCMLNVLNVLLDISRILNADIIYYRSGTVNLNTVNLKFHLI